MISLIISEIISNQIAHVSEQESEDDELIIIIILFCIIFTHHRRGTRKNADGTEAHNHHH